MHNNLKLLLVIHRLEIGGAENAFISLISHLHSSGFLISIATFAESDQIAEQKIPEIPVKVLNLGFNPVSTIAGHIQTVRPNLIISFMDQTNILCLLSKLLLKLTNRADIPILVCERNNPKRNLILNRSLPFAIQEGARALRNFLYRFSSSICVQSGGARDFFISKGIKKPIAIIPNFVNTPPTILTQRKYIILAVARLVPEKGLIELVQAFIFLAKRYPEWSLQIYGEGPLRLELSEQINLNKLEDRIFLKGKNRDLSQIYREAAIFVLNSDYEGFPNALMEAASHGCACIAKNCEFGPSEIIKHKISGILISPGSPLELPEALELLIQNPELRTRLGSRAMIEMTSHFLEDSFVSSFKELINANLSQHSKLADANNHA